MLLVAAPGTSAVDRATATSVPIRVPAETHMFMQPNFTIYGSMNAEDLRSIMDEGYEKFCEYVERYEREKRRTQYGT